MKLAALVLALGGCDFTPATPTPAPASPTPASTSTSTSPSPPTIAQPDPVTPDCIAVADHLVDLATAAITSDAERAVQTANHARNVRATAEACTRASWSAALQQCFAAAKTQAEAGACGSSS